MRNYSGLGFALALTLSLLVSQRSEAKLIGTLSSEATSRQALRHQARMMSPLVFSSHKTLAAPSLRQLIQLSAPVAADAPLRYSNFNSYWQAANQTNQRTGKTLEAVFAWRANQALQASGQSSRILVTAAEGFPSHPVDLAEVSPDGAVLRRFQSKFNLDLRRASKSLTDPRYQGQTLLTTRESLVSVESELLRLKGNAARRGIPLAPQWQMVRDSLEDGRLARQWAGKPLPSQKGLRALTQRETRDAFEEAAARRFVRSEPLVASAGKAAGRQVLAKSLYVVDLSSAAYLQYQDIGRFSQGEISGDYLAIKSGVRGAQLCLATYTLVTPEPFSKIAGTVIVVTVIVVDIATDFVYDGVHHRRESAARQALASIDRTERYHAVRSLLSAGSSETGKPATF